MRSFQSILEENHGSSWQIAARLYLETAELVWVPTTTSSAGRKLLCVNLNIPFYIGIHDLARMWFRGGLVHTSLTELTHHPGEEAITVTWHEDLRLGVADYSAFARGIRDGTKYPNLRVSGVADFAHVEHFDDPAESLGAFARSMVEAILLMSQRVVRMKFEKGSFRWRPSSREGAFATMVLLAEALASNGARYDIFVSTWRSEGLDGIVDDVKESEVSDHLDLARLVRAAEVFAGLLFGQKVLEARSS